MTVQPYAGWYPDPYQPGAALRWWDGSHWSDRTRPLAEVPPPPGAPAGLPPLAAPAPPWGSSLPVSPHPSPTWGYPPSSNGQPAPGAVAPTRLTAPDRGGAPATYAQRNSLSLTTLGVVAAYILLATTTHFVLIGILPMGLSIRALSRREPLAPVALVAAIVSVVFSLSVLTHH